MISYTQRKKGDMGKEKNLPT